MNKSLFKVICVLFFFLVGGCSENTAPEDQETSTEINSDLKREIEDLFAGKNEVYQFKGGLSGGFN